MLSYKILNYKIHEKALKVIGNIPNFYMLYKVADIPLLGLD